MESDFETCLSKINKFLKRYPKSEEVWLIKGNLGNEIFNTQMAKQSFMEALKINPDYPKALAGMGVVMRREKKYGEAEDYYYKALKLDSELYLAKSSLMLLELRKENYDVAIALGEDSIKKGIKNVQPRIIENLMIAYHYSEEFEKRNYLFSYLKEIEYSRLFALDLVMGNYVSIEELLDA
ncbi:tetratricopeptide repeat protein [Spongiimicrobium salis]|uniref:tetratricopeptide repeat protein n=1 Tax=Spongiimicrobium salis TaxID=1667022 RepID=UPI00374D39B7